MRHHAGSTTRTFVSGVLLANALPHLASALAGRRHLTPLAGRDSSPAVNLVWAMANASVGGVLLRSAAGDASTDQRWDERLLSFEAGALTLTLWMLMSERLGRVNHGPARP